MSNSVKKEIVSASPHTNQETYERLWYFIMFLAMGVGTYSRLKGIGKWPLAVDEYFMAKSVRTIVEYGVPKFECGGYYFRGVLYQYIAAPFFLFCSRDEFFLRIIPAIFNILAIPPIYWLGKRLSGVTTACLCVSLFALSLWEIEFSRFGRMYAPFQTIFLWYVFFLYRVIIEGDDHSKKWMYLLSFMSIFVYEGHIFLVMLNFFPFLLKRKDMRLADLLISIAVFLFTVMYHFDFKPTGVMPLLPNDVPIEKDTASSIPLPFFLFQTISSNPIWMGLSLFPILLTVYGTYGLVASKDLDRRTKICICALIFLSLFNLFGLIIGLSSIFILLNILYRNSIDKKLLKRCIVILCFNFIFWILYGLTTEEWKLFFGKTQIVPSWKIIVVLFKYPDVFWQIIYPWKEVIPRTGIISAVIISIGVLATFKRPFDQCKAFRFLVSLLFILCLMIGTINMYYRLSRYTFFLYPIIVLLFTESMNSLIRSVAGTSRKSLVLLLAFTFIYLSYSEDYSLSHMINIDSKEVNFRMNMYPKLGGHYYRRMDYRTPAQTINQHLQDDDIVISTLGPPDYYLNRLDYYYCDYREHDFSSISACSGKRERWSNAKLIYKEDSLWSILDNQHSTIWLIAQAEKAYYRPTISRKILKKYSKDVFGKSMDGMINVYKISRSR
ncbi:MAG: ArnT family glycosyltransferase [Candidatus Hodarchaeota archaeon]